MTPLELTVDILNRNVYMLNMTLADFSDADMLVRPCAGANHAAWQLGHVISAETRMGEAVMPGKMPALPEGFEKQFTTETAGKDDPASFPNKAALLEQFAKTRAGTVNWVKTLTPADMDKPGPARMLQMVPTVGHLVALFPNHLTMHVGQFQVIRRKLGKPVLF